MLRLRRRRLQPPQRRKRRPLELGLPERRRKLRLLERRPMRQPLERLRKLQQRAGQRRDSRSN